VGSGRKSQHRLRPVPLPHARQIRQSRPRKIRHCQITLPAHHYSLTADTDPYILYLENTLGGAYMALHQVNIAFPEPLYQQFIRLVPAGQRTRFLTELAEAGLQRLKLQKALNETYGAWSRQPHDELKGGVDRYIRRQRRDRNTSR
jgi:hypothetical protein